MRKSSDPHLPELKPDTVVWDDLTRSPALIVRVDYDEWGNAGVYLSTNYLDGGRFPGEISACGRETE